MSGNGRFYLTTPIYYVNDRPHLGHVFTTTASDVAGRAHRLLGDETFLLTGTDEHAAKVADAAEERGVSPIEWADRNAEIYIATWGRQGIAYDDFIRTTEPRHGERVRHYMKALLDSGDLYLGQYSGWYDPGEEEYVPDARAKEHALKSPVSGRPLVRRSEENFFFRLSAYEEALLTHYAAHPEFVLPEARRNEVVGRVREGLNDVPASRTGAGEWGIPFPGHAEHTVYVWVDALFNYLSAVDTPDRRHLWPADVHLIGKDILWFHAVIWPAVLMALRKCPGYEWIELPQRVYAHSFWVSEGQKMSKSLGNFVDLAVLDDYATRFGLDALRWYLITQGPLGRNDGDFAEARFVEVYNGDLANTLGNCVNRVTNMTGRYLGGRVAEPATHPESDVLPRAAADAVSAWNAALERLALDDCAAAGLDLVRAVDAVIEKTRPFQLAKDEGSRPVVGAILYDCAEALRIASLLLWPVMPRTCEALWERWGQTEYGDALRDRGRGSLDRWTRWQGLEPGTELAKGDPLFPRYAP